MDGHQIHPLSFDGLKFAGKKFSKIPYSPRAGNLILVNGVARPVPSTSSNVPDIARPTLENLVDVFKESFPDEWIHSYDAFLPQSKNPGAPYEGMVYARDFGGLIGWGLVSYSHWKSESMGADSKKDTYLTHNVNLSLTLPASDEFASAVNNAFTKTWPNFEAINYMFSEGLDLEEK